MTTNNAIGHAGLAADYILGTMRLTCSEAVRDKVREAVRLAVLGVMPTEKLSINSDWWKPAYRSASDADNSYLMLSVEIEAAKIDAVVSMLNASRISDESVLSAMSHTVSVLASHAV